MPRTLSAVKRSAAMPTALWALAFAARQLLGDRLVTWVNQRIDNVFIREAAGAMIGDGLFFAILAAAAMAALTLHRSNLLEEKQTAWTGTLITLRDTALYFKRLIDGDADRDRWIIVDHVSHAFERMQLELPAFRLLLVKTAEALATKEERDRLFTLGLLGDDWMQQQRSEWVSDLRQIERFIDKAAGRLGIALAPEPIEQR